MFASFSQPSYTFLESSVTQELFLDVNSVLAKSIQFQLTPGKHYAIIQVTKIMAIIEYNAML